MRRRHAFALVTASAAVLTVLAAATPVAASQIRPPKSGTWGLAEEVPGTGGLNTQGSAAVQAVSCSAAGDCVAGGFYTTKAATEGFLATQRNGRWSKAFKVPGRLVAQGSNVSAVSCPSTGNCTAAGSYVNSAGGQDAFVVDQHKGRWQAAVEVPGSGALDRGGVGGISSLACVSAGNCVAAGFYEDHANNLHIYTVTERNGTWHDATPVPGVKALGVGTFIMVDALSCPSIGECVLGGTYLDRHAEDEALLATEKNGRWQAAQEVPGTAKLNASGQARVQVGVLSVTWQLRRDRRIRGPLGRYRVVRH